MTGVNQAQGICVIDGEEVSIADIISIAAEPVPEPPYWNAVRVLAAVVGIGLVLLCVYGFAWGTWSYR